MEYFVRVANLLPHERTGREEITFSIPSERIQNGVLRLEVGTQNEVTALVVLRVEPKEEK